MPSKASELVITSDDENIGEKGSCKNLLYDKKIGFINQIIIE